MTPPIHMGLAQHPINMGRGRGLSHFYTGKINSIEQGTTIKIMTFFFKAINDFIMKKSLNITKIKK